MILVTGATGFVGRAVCEILVAQGRPYRRTSLSGGVDLRDRTQTRDLFREVSPSDVVNCAAFVGGIQFGYEHPIRIFEDNLLIMLNLLWAARESGVRRIVNPISNCAYPGEATVFRESEFWNGRPHDSVLPYGFVRRAFWVGSWVYRQESELDVLNLVMSNMYGPGDHFDEKRSHALGALVAKIVDAKLDGCRSVVVWGSGKPVREWLYVMDGASALVRGLEARASADVVNVGVQKGISVADLARLIAAEVGYDGVLNFDTARPDGAPCKTVDGSRGEALLGWRPQVGLKQGIRETVRWYLAQKRART